MAARQALTRVTLAALAVDVFGRYRLQVDVVETAHVDGARLAAVFARAGGEGFDAAHRAEQVIDDFGVEAVLGQNVRAAQQLEVLRGDEAQHGAASPAHGAVTSERRLGEIE